VSEAIFERGALVTTAAEANAEPVAQFTMAAVVWAFKKVPFLAADARHHRADWSYRERRGELSGRDRTVVLIGYSRVGRRVTQLLVQLGLARVLVVDPVADPAEIAAAGAEPVTLERALPQADVLSLHAPSLPETRHLIGEAELAELPPHAVLINTARGALVDTAALERACVGGGLHAILDVTEPEPLPADHPLLDAPNLLVVPHVGSATVRTRARMAAMAVENLLAALAGRPMPHPVT
jgi:phosphoglycerate dehydrogenase-like enzyme